MLSQQPASTSRVGQHAAIGIATERCAATRLIDSSRVGQYACYWNR